MWYIIFFIHCRDFERLEQEEEQDLLQEEPEVRLTREEILARYQVCVVIVY